MSAFLTSAAGCGPGVAMEKEDIVPRDFNGYDIDCGLVLLY